LQTRKSPPLLYAAWRQYRVYKGETFSLSAQLYVERATIKLTFLRDALSLCTFNLWEALAGGARALSTLLLSP
jgi:hypothetical protein